MMSCSSSTHYLLEWTTHNKQLNSDDAAVNKLWDAFHSFMLSSMSESPPSSASSIIGALRVKMVELKKPRFGTGQEDAGEGFHLLLECMGNDEYSKLYMHRYEHDIYCTQCKKIVSTRSDESYHIEIPPNYEAAIVEWVDDERVKYSGLLNQYVRHHVTILDDFTCPVCKVTKRMIRLSHLVLVPEVLVIIFNKFTNKFQAPCPAELSFPGINVGDHIGFKLVAKIEHSGTMGGGHYVAHCLRKAGVYMFNDSTVSDGNFDTSRNTYICFYHVV